jgi:hypothetical protein
MLQDIVDAYWILHAEVQPAISALIAVGRRFEKRAAIGRWITDGSMSIILLYAVGLIA